MTTEQYRAFSPTIPTDPGVYRFMSADNVVLYVGKAKNLRNRLNSYFGEKKHQLAKTKALIKNADHIVYTIVNSEHDALLLENTFIKKNMPRYNVMLKDEKSPLVYICVKKERFPRVFMVRKPIKDGSVYLGPYLSKGRVDGIVELIKKLFQLRTCTLALTEENIGKGKFKPCLEYHIKNCAAPCIALESEESYNAKIEQIKNILKGNFGAVKQHLHVQMAEYVERLEFENAQNIKQKLALFEDYQGKSTVVNPNIHDVDVFAIATSEEQEEAYVNYMRVVNGAIINAYNMALTKNLDEDLETMLIFAIEKLREKFNSIAPEIIVPMPLAYPDAAVVVTVPKIGDKKKLLELAEKNVVYHSLQMRKMEASIVTRVTSAERILTTLKSDLQMSILPLHIECFDNSNLQGTNPVSSCVVFKQAKPAKRDYRHYNIKTVEGPNDFASMEEVVYRRYKRLLAEGSDLPQLIIIDGGKGQLSAAKKSLEALNILEKVTVIGIAKRLEEIFFPDDPIPLYINKKSESLKLIQQARNEAHRFGITFHRNKRSQNFLKTELTDIPGIGAKTSEKLLIHFGSVKKLRETAADEVEKVVGKAALKKIMEYFKGDGDTDGVDSDGIYA